MGRPVLTIGMIVKNEEKILEKTLRALQPIRDELSCELIIADTGSTDNTVKIVEKYADTVFYYPWQNDFAAARNAVVDRAKGEWYLSLDADECFDSDVSDLVSFFTTQEYKKYKTGILLFYNYTDVNSEDTYAQIQLVRMFAMNDNQRFHGAIHEYFYVNKPTRYFSTIIHHYGYQYESYEILKKKTERNLKPLLAQLEKEPNNLRTLTLTIDVTLDDKDKEKLLNRAMVLVKKDPSYPYCKRIFSQMMSFCLKMGKWNQVTELFKEYESLYDQHPSIVDTDMVYCDFMAQMAIGNYDNAIKSGEQYFQLLEKDKKGTLSKEGLFFCEVNNAGINAQQEAYAQLSYAYFCQENYSQAIKTFQRIDLTRVIPDKAVNIFCQIATQTECEELANQFYHQIYDLAHSEEEKDMGKANIYYRLLEANMALMKEEDRFYFLDQFADISLEDEFIALIHLESNENSSSFVTEFENYMLTISDWNRAMSDVYWFAVKYGLKLPKEAFTIEPERMDVISSNIVSKEVDIFNEFCNASLKYSRSFETFGEIHKLFFFVSLFEKLMQRIDYLDEIEQKEEVINRYTEFAHVWMERLFHPEMFQEENIIFIPKGFQFIYWFQQGQELERAKNYSESMKYYRKALKADGSLKSVMNFVMDRLGEKINRLEEEEENRKNEFNLLSIEIKKKVKVLIKEGYLTDAKGLLEQLHKMIPEDEEIVELLDFIEEK